MSKTIAEVTERAYEILGTQMGGAVEAENETSILATRSLRTEVI